MTFSYRRRSPRQQRGSIIVFAALGLSLALLMLAVADLGFLFLYKREYQKAADLAALAGAKQLVINCTAAQTAATSSAVQNLGDRSHQAPVIECGEWKSGRTPQFVVPGGATPLNAVHATIKGTPPRFFLRLFEDADEPLVLTADAIATTSEPLAALSIRSQLLALNTENSALLDALVGGLLGGGIDLGVLGWQGLAQTDITLLDYLDALPAVVDLGLNVGDYEELLAAEVSLADLIEAAATVVGEDSAVGLSLLQFIDVDLLENTEISLGELLGVGLATPEAALDVGLNLFDMVMAMVQVANGESAIAAEVPLAVPGIADLTVKLKVIEGPQFSDIGNPATDEIAVRTAQIRAVVSADLQVLGIVNDLLGAVTDLLGPLTSVVNDLLNLDLIAVVDGVINLLSTLACGGLLPCPTYDAIYTKVLEDNKIDISVDVGSAYSEVDDYDCENSETKSLDVNAKAAVGELRIGKIDDPFALHPMVAPVDILQLGEQTVRPDSCLLLICWNLKYQKGSQWVANRDEADTRVKLGIRLAATNSPILGGGDQPLVFNAPLDRELPDTSGLKNPEEEQIYKPIAAEDLVGSLADTLDTIDLELYETSDDGGLLELLTGVLNATLVLLIDGLLAPLVTALGAILDPLLEFLLNALGIDLANAETAARLTCNMSGATLVQ